MALVERKRIDGPPRGGAKREASIRDSDDYITRADIEAIIGKDLKVSILPTEFKLRHNL